LIDIFNQNWMEKNIEYLIYSMVISQVYTVSYWPTHITKNVMPSKY